MGQRYSPERASFATYKVTFKEQKPVVQAMRAIAADPASTGNVFLYGSVGTGKDHLLAACLYAAVNVGLTAAWASGQEIYSRFRDAMDTGRSEEALLAEYTRDEILAISDPIPAVVDPKKPAAWRTELLYRILDRRYRDMRPTWITANAEDDADAEAKLSRPVFDRLRDDAIVFPCFWPSARKERRR